MHLRLTHKLRGFVTARGGNVATIFAFALIPILALVGSAIDYSRGNAVKVEMQSAVDAVSLMLQKTAPSLSHNDLQAVALSYFKSVFKGGYGAHDIRVSSTYSKAGGSSVVVTASAEVPTTFMGLFGYDNMTVSSSTTAKWGNSRLRVALVLDNTGSMSQDGKMSALQTATNNLLGQLKKAATTEGDVYVSIIPFVKDVNLDPSNYSAYWIDWKNWDAANGTCNKSKYHDESKCIANHGKWTPDNHDTWNGCVVDRGDDAHPDSANYDTNVDEPTTSIPASLFSAEQYVSCPQASMGLNYNWSAMTSLVNNMSPAGNTNQAIGLALGWMSLVGGGPFTAPAMDSNYKYQQVIILLTDGLNTQDRWYKNRSQIDARQQMTCDNIKAARITLYTIQVNTGGDPTSTLLQNCASDASKFFLLTSANQMVTTFAQIGTDLTKLYLAK